MKWEHTLELLRLAGRSPRERREERAEPDPSDSTRPRAASICVASGKGGTGKSVTSASLAWLFSRLGRTLIVDADLGVGNAHILQNVSPPHSLVDVVEGSLSVEQVVMPCQANLDLLSAGSGVSHMASLSSYELQIVASGLAALESAYDFVVVDSAAGISTQTVSFAAACDLVLVVTTPDLTAMTDAYAFLKVMHQREEPFHPLLLVNRAHSMQEAEHVAERMCNVSRKFLGFEPRWIGTVPEDRAVVEAVNQRCPVVAHDPNAPAAQSLRSLVGLLRDELKRRRSEGLGQTLSARAGFSPGYA